MSKWSASPWGLQSSPPSKKANHSVTLKSAPPPSTTATKTKKKSAPVKKSTEGAVSKKGVMKKAPSPETPPMKHPAPPRGPSHHHLHNSPPQFMKSRPRPAHGHHPRGMPPQQLQKVPFSAYSIADNLKTNTSTSNSPTTEREEIQQRSVPIGKKKNKNEENVKSQQQQQQQNQQQQQRDIFTELSDTVSMEMSPRSWMDVSEDAMALLRGIRTSDVNALRNLPNPPQLIKDIMATVLIIFGHTDSSWTACKNFLGNRLVISTLQTFDISHVTLKDMKVVRRFVKKDSFSVEHAKKISLASAALCAWVLAVYNYESQHYPELGVANMKSGQVENYDGIPREYDLLNSTSHKNFKEGKKKSKMKSVDAQVPEHIKAIKLLNADELGKVPLKDQLRGLHQELLEESIDNLQFDGDNNRNIQSSSPAILQESIPRNDLSEEIPLEEPFYFDEIDNRQLATKRGPPEIALYTQSDHIGAQNVNVIKPMQGISLESDDISPQQMQNRDDDGDSLEAKFAELIIDKSRIVKVAMIGEGYFGEVWRGVWDDNQAVALKCLKHGVKSTVKNRFFTEVASLAKMRHPNITVFYGATPPPEAFIISELLQCSLYQLIYSYKYKRGGAPAIPTSTPKPLPLKAILRILSDVSYGGNYLHNMKPNPVIHRDLTSSNVLLTVPSTISDEELLLACDDHSKPIAKLTDFGLSREVDWCMTACVGNLFYLAPEVYTGDHYSVLADIYSFGILMWEIVARESPHGGVNPQRVAFLAATQSLRPPLSSNNITSESFRALNRKCWNADPTQRPSFKEISQQLQKLRSAMYPVSTNQALRQQSSRSLTPQQSTPSPVSLALEGNYEKNFSDASAQSVLGSANNDSWQQTRNRLDAFLLNRPSLQQLSKMGEKGSGIIPRWLIRERQEDAARSLPPGDKHNPMHELLAEVAEEDRATAIHNLMLKRSGSNSDSGSGGSLQLSRDTSGGS